MRPSCISLVFVLTVFSSFQLKAQSNVSVEPLAKAERMPSFPEGQAALLRYLAQNLEYPRIAKENGVYGMVVVQMIVERDGSLSNVRAIKGIGAGCDEEAERVVRSMPKWTPGFQNGEPVRVQFNLPIRYKLDN